MPGNDPRLAQLLAHPALWRGRNAARVPVVPTGFEALDASLPGGGWPRTGLVELLVPRLGIGELRLLMPALAALSREPSARWCAWIAPPFEPFAPALVAHGVALGRVLVVRAPTPLWALEQSLASGACDTVLAWVRQAHPRALRRLQLAAEHGRALGLVFRAPAAASEPSAAVLRLQLAPASDGLRITLLKSRGGARGSLRIDWNAGHE